MIPDWPAYLPRPLRNSYGAQRQEARYQRETDAGPPLYRRRFTAATRTLQLSMVLDIDQKHRFDRFFRVTLQHGSLPFRMPDPVEHLAPALDENGDRICDENDDFILNEQMMLCLFGAEPPVEGAVRGRVREISFTVLELPS